MIMGGKYFALCIIGTAVIIWVIRIYGNVIMNMIFVPIVLWMSVSAVFKVAYRIKCGHYIIVYTAIFDMELLFEFLSETKADTLQEIGMVRVSDYPWELFLITVLNYSLFLIMKQLSKKFPLKEKNKEITKYMYILPAILGTFILVLCLGININDSFISKTVTIVFFICMLVGNMIYFCGLQLHVEILNKVHVQGLQIACYKSEIEHLSQVSELNEDICETLHNTAHYLKMIRELAHQNRNQELCEMVDEFCGKLKRENIYEYS